MKKSSVKKIWIPKTDSNPGRILMEEEKEEKKQTKFLEPFETAVRMATKSGRGFLEEYERNHKESNQEREDGWISDLPRNLARAGEEGIKKFKVSKILDLY